MNDPNFGVFLLMLANENYERNHMRIQRRNLRDNHNPFDMSDVQFIRNFRLSKFATQEIIDFLAQHAIQKYRNTGIPFHLRVLVTLYFLSNGSYQGVVGGYNSLSMSQTSVSRAIAEVTTLITRHMMPLHINFPTTFNERSIIKQGFYGKWHMRGVLGVVDGTHVEIVAPAENDMNHPPFVYINRKVNARYPGSVHDAAIWQMSDIRQYLRGQYENGDKSSFLVGDSGYGLEPWLFTPFLNCARGSPEERYNTLHKRTRNVIERTNGILKGRFRCLSRHRVLHYTPSKAAYIIYSCAVLHNIAIKARLPIDEEIICQENNEEVEHVFQNENIDQNDNTFNAGRQARNGYIQRNLL